MAYTTINKSTAYFNTKLYTGNGGTQSITGVGFQPDWSWIKRRDGGTSHHQLFDAVRGATKRIYSSSNAAEDTAADTLTAFDSDGFSVGANAGVNGSSNATVAWNWKANGQGSSNTDGSINTTYTSVNTTAGFSIVKWTGTGSAGTLGHGLTTTPKMIIVKNLSDSVNWFVYNHSVITASATNKSFMTLNSGDGIGTNGSATTFTSVSNTTFGVGTDNIINGSGDNMIAYCFAEKTGYSKFGKYSGNNNANGPFIYTGFKPAFLMIKYTNSGQNWITIDNKRPGYNLISAADSQNLRPNTNDAEITSNGIDLLSNGFKCRSSDGDSNGYTNSYIYMAFGQSIVGSNNIPCTAR